MFRNIAGVLVGLALLAAYLMLSAVALLLLCGQKLTGTEPVVELTGTEDDPY